MCGGNKYKQFFVVVLLGVVLEMLCFGVKLLLLRLGICVSIWVRGSGIIEEVKNARIKSSKEFTFGQI